MKRHHLFLLLIFLGTTACDQSTKKLAHGLVADGPRELAGGLLRLDYALNSGGFLSLGSQLSPTLRFALFVVGVGFGLLAIAYLAWSRHTPRNASFGFALMLGGGFGNLIDRILNGGSVRDFAVLRWGDWSTGVFNLADTSILVGAAIVLISGGWTTPAADEPPPPAERSA